MKDLEKRTIKMIVLTLAMVFGVVASRPMCAEAAVVNVNNFADLQSKLQNGYSVKLTANITVPTNESIMVDNGNVILDLNGYTIDFNQNYGIMIFSQLTLKDSRVNGKIKNCAGPIIDMGINAEFNLEGGELSNCEADGVMVGLDDTFNMSGGKICNNKRSGVVINSGATFNMTGGEISNNEEYGVECRGTFKMSGTSKICNNDGCGFYGLTNSAINMDGGEISGNHDGGAQINSVFTMTGGKIINNERTKDYANGAGVNLIRSNAVFTMSGGTISGNWLEDKDTENGAGVYVYDGATFKISGAPVISDNYQGGTKGNDGKFTGARKSNVFINNSLINSHPNFIVVGKLTGAEGSIGVLLECDMFNITKNDNCSYFVKGNDEENSEYELTDSDMKVFFSDKSKYNVYLYQELNKAVLLTEWGYIATEAGNASEDSDNPTVIKLKKDYNLTKDELVRLEIVQDTYVVIDMNGYNIKKVGECGYPLISNNGNLILTDNSTGAIKGCIDGNG
ncbi:MAG: right-handed parallel beta-helix repeat-containing protein, partial [Lachnospiraceae bacterium]|nr:right-handed parallel beta-helix repeat-containing protein [Lachnospiraceae bacterium]